jgi:hypothetical protein
MTLLGGAQGEGVVTIGSAGNNAAAIVGQSGGNATFQLRKSETGTSFLYFLNVDGSPSDGDYYFVHQNDENFGLKRHDGVDGRNILFVSDDTNLQLLSGAQGGHNVYIGPSSGPAYNSNLHIGQNLANSALFMRKAEGGTATIYFYNVDTTASSGDYFLQQESDEDFSLQRHDGTDWRQIVRITDDTAMTLLGGAQGFATVAVGNNSQGARLSIGAFGGNADLYLQKSDGGSSNILFNSITSALSDGDFRLIQFSNETLGLERHDGTDWRSILYVNDDTAMTLLGGAQDTWSITLGNASEAGELLPGLDSVVNIGDDTTRFHTIFMDGYAVGFLDSDTNLTLSANETYLEAASATQRITLPDAATVGAGQTFFIDLQVAHSTGEIKNQSGDTINDNDKSGTGITSSPVGLYILVSDGVSNWEMHGPITRVDTAG